MTSSAFWGFGALLQYGNGATPEVFTSIAEATAIKPPALSRDSMEMTNHSSTNAWREFLPGLRDGGEVTYEGNWLPTNATQNGTTGVLESFNDNENHNWKFVLPGSILTISFTGHVTAFEGESPMDNVGKLSLTIKISGEVTFA